MTATDIGLEPAAGINPPLLSLQNLKSPRETFVAGETHDYSEISNPLTSELTDLAIVEECELNLTPQQLMCIVLGI